MQQFIRHIRQHPLISLAGVLTVAATLLILTVAALAALGVSEMQQRATAALQAHIIFAPDTEQQQVQAVADELLTWSEVAGVEVKDGAANLAWLQQESSRDLSGLKPGLLPTTLRVTFKRPTEALPSLRERLTALEEQAAVESLELNSPEVVHMVSSLELLRWILLGVAVGITLTGVAIMANVQGVGVFRRRDEIEIMRMVGATSRHIAGPLYRESLGLGLLGGLLSAAALAGVYVVAGDLFVNAAPLLKSELDAAGLWLAPAVPVAGVLVAWCGTTLCMRSYVRQVEGIA